MVEVGAGGHATSIAKSSSVSGADPICEHVEAHVGELAVGRRRIILVDEVGDPEAAFAMKEPGAVERAERIERRLRELGCRGVDVLEHGLEPPGIPLLPIRRVARP